MKFSISGTIQMEIDADTPEEAEDKFCQKVETITTSYSVDDVSEEEEENK